MRSDRYTFYLSIDSNSISEDKLLQDVVAEFMCERGRDFWRSRYSHTLAVI